MDDQQGRAGDDSHAVDIASLKEELSVKLDAERASAVQLGGGSPPCPTIIAEVGLLTRNVNPGNYDPHHISIGPYHRLRNRDLARDDEKIRSLGVILLAARTGTTSLGVYLDELKRLEGQARSCYAHKFEMESKEFLLMLLLDGCYLLARFASDDAQTGNGPVQGGAPLVSAAGSGDRLLEDVAVVRDVLYLAENQIPFFIVDKIHQLTVSEGSVSAADKITNYVRELLRTQQYSVAEPPVPMPGNLLHVLHMHFRLTVPPSATGGETTGKPVGRWRTATEYHFAGVKFKPRTLGQEGVQCILDVKLDGGTLEIPTLNIDAETWRLLRNLMALEQRNPEVAGSHVTAYCVFMSQVACTAADVELLSRREVIAHGLGNNGEVAKCFADLCKGIVFNPDDPRTNYLRATCQALEKRFQSGLQRSIAWLKQKYFTNPWLTLGLAAAAVGLACTVLQAVFSVLSYKPGPH